MPESSEKQESKTPPAADQTQADQPAERPTSTASPEPFEVAVLALQNLTLFPETVVPLGVGRPRSIAAVEAALSTQEKLLGCITVRPDTSSEGDATSADLYEVGMLVMIKRMERLGDAMRIVAQGTRSEEHTSELQSLTNL